MSSNLEPLWTVNANIVEKHTFGPGGKEKRIGTKHFKPGTKVYIVDWFPGGISDIVVVGLARKPRRFIKIVISVMWVENLRVKLCYNPSALKKIYSHFDTENDNVSRLTKEFAEEMERVIPTWQEL